MAFVRTLPENKDLEGVFDAAHIGNADACPVLRLDRNGHAVATMKVVRADSLALESQLRINVVSDFKPQPKPLPNVVQVECQAQLSLSANASATGHLFRITARRSTILLSRSNQDIAASS